MCGLAGYARHPDGKHHELATLVGLDLLVAMQSRGTHATGIGVFGKDEAFICKSAVQASVAIESKPWKEAIDKVDEKTTIFLGHTRHSTHPTNTKLDEAAHPFHIGNVVGAHNGIITNWKDVWNEIGNKNQPIWIVDSQAAIGALDAISDPVKALDLLDGYFALSWVKRDEVYFARTGGYGAPIAVAYVPEMLTLFWASTMGALESILKRAKIDQFDAFELAPNNVYRMNPMRFDANGIHAEKKHAEFKGTKTKPTQQQIAMTSGGKKAGKPVPRSEINGLTAPEAVSLLLKHDRILLAHMRKIAEMEQEIERLVRLAKEAGIEFPDGDEEDGQLELIGAS